MTAPEKCPRCGEECINEIEVQRDAARPEYACGSYLDREQTRACFIGERDALRAELAEAKAKLAETERQLDRRKIRHVQREAIELGDVLSTPVVPERVPEGSVPIGGWLHEGTYYIVGYPDEETDPDHSCDAMGCGLYHIVDHAKSIAALESERAFCDSLNENAALGNLIARACGKPEEPRLTHEYEEMVTAFVAERAEMKAKLAEAEAGIQQLSELGEAMNNDIAILQAERAGMVTREVAERACGLAAQTSWLAAERLNDDGGTHTKTSWWEEALSAASTMHTDSWATRSKAALARAEAEAGKGGE